MNFYLKGEFMQEEIKLLIVDDSTIIRSTIEKHLSAFNITIVGSAADGLEALEIFKKARPAYVTLDITMPELDGLKVLEEILKVEPKTKVLVVTALSDKETGIQAFELGAMGIVIKPFTPAKLQEEFDKLIRKS